MRPNDFRPARVSKADALSQPAAEQGILLVADDDPVGATLREVSWPVHQAQWMPL